MEFLVDDSSVAADSGERRGLTVLQVGERRPITGAQAIVQCLRDRANYVRRGVGADGLRGVRALGSASLSAGLSLPPVRPTLRLRRL